VLLVVVLHGLCNAVEQPVKLAAEIFGSLPQVILISRDDQQNRARAVAMMRHGFGGHPFGKDESIAHKRGTQRIGQIVRQKE
jgi:hypothetical protein